MVHFIVDDLHFTVAKEFVIKELEQGKSLENNRTEMNTILCVTLKTDQAHLKGRVPSKTFDNYICNNLILTLLGSRGGGGDITVRRKLS